MSKKRQRPLIHTIKYRSGQVSYKVDLGLVEGKRKRLNFGTTQGERIKNEGRQFSRRRQVPLCGHCSVNPALQQGPAQGIFGHFDGPKFALQSNLSSLAPVTIWIKQGKVH